MSDFEVAGPGTQRLIDRIIEMLRVATCPSCDGSGVIPQYGRLGDVEAEQCQWCYERKELLDGK